MKKKSTKPKPKNWSKEPLTKEEADEITRRASNQFKAKFGFSPNPFLFGTKPGSKNAWMEILYFEMQAFFREREAARLGAAATVPDRDYVEVYKQRKEAVEKDPLVEEAISNFPEAEVQVSGNSENPVAAPDMPW